MHTYIHIYAYIYIYTLCTDIHKLKFVHTNRSIGYNDLTQLAPETRALPIWASCLVYSVLSSQSAY